MIPFIPIFPLMNRIEFNEKPPTLYSIMQSIVNYHVPYHERTNIYNLAKEARSKIFDFDYPLDSSVDKEEFECVILNHFIKRRIGTETVTEFKINLNVRLNSIMPIYNKLFNLLFTSKGFGNIITKTGNNNKKVNTTNKVDTSTNANTTGNNTQNTITDSRNSELPQNQLQNLKDGSYASNSDYTTQDVTNNIKSQDTSTSSQSQNGNTIDDTVYEENETNTNMLEILNSEMQSIYNRLFKDLDDLFYQLV